MYRALLVDDEHLVIRGINSCINWSSAGFMPPLEAYSAEQALNILNEQPIDVVITDIKMYPMSGLELMEEIKRREYPCEIIILSCYNDFSYSRAALQNGACDYLFKPEMLPQDIIEALKKAVERLNRRHDNCENIENMRVQLTQAECFRRQTLLRELVDGKRLSKEQLLQAAKTSLLPLTSGSINIMALHLCNARDVLAKNYNNDEYLFKYGITNVLEEIIMQEKSCALLPYSTELYLIFTGNENKISESGERSQLNRLGLTILNTLSYSFGLKAVCGIGTLNRPIEKIQLTAEEAMHCVMEHLISGQIVFCEDQNVFPVREESRTLLDTLYCAGQADSPVQRVKHMFESLRKKQNISRDILVELCGNIISIHIHSLRTNTISQIYNQMGDLFSNLSHLHTLEEFETYLCSFVRLASEKEQGRREVQDACAYMEARLSDSSLSLEEVSNHVGMSKCYFSNLFKENSGIGFSAYLTSLRLKKAEQIYREGRLKIYQLAQEVGFSDWRYLSRAYKKQFGRNLTDLK